jgi:pimeloyl-ACP methyl ester carboxylesterase
MGATTQDFFVHSADVRLAVRDYGGDGPPLMFIHGGPGPNLASWDAFAKSMSDSFRCVAYDQRGHGQSDDADEYSYAALTADIQAIASALGLEAPLPGLEIYDAIRCPLLFAMAHRGLYPLRLVERVAARAQARVAWLDCGHDVQSEQPEQLRQCIRAFVALP